MGISPVSGFDDVEDDWGALLDDDLKSVVSAVPSSLPNAFSAPQADVEIESFAKEYIANVDAQNQSKT